MSITAFNEACQFQEENCKTHLEPTQPQPAIYNQQLNVSLIQSLSLPLMTVDLKDKKTLLNFATGQNFEKTKAELEAFFQKNLNEEVLITPTSNDNEIALEFATESTSNYIYNSLKNELELLSLIDSNENLEEKEETQEDSPEKSSPINEEDKDSQQLEEIIKKKQYKEYQTRKPQVVQCQMIQYTMT